MSSNEFLQFKNLVNNDGQNYLRYYLQHNKDRVSLVNLFTLHRAGSEFFKLDANGNAPIDYLDSSLRFFL